MNSAWRNELVARIDAFDRWVRGRVVIDRGPADELVATQSFVDTTVLRGAVARSMSIKDHPAGAGNHNGRADRGFELGVAASRFARHYSASLTAAALVGLSRGIGLDLSAGRCTMIIRHNVPFCLLLDTPDEEVLRAADRETLRAEVWRRLYAEHLLPVFARMVDITHVSPALLWCNAAEWVGILSDAAVEYLDQDEAEPIVAECRALLDAPTLPGVPGGNPLGDRLEWIPGDGNGFPETVQTRSQCCLTYLLDDRFGRLCQSCPYLPLSDRIALVRERHGVPMGTPGGAAEQRAIERGLARPSARRALARRARRQAST